MPVCGLFRSQGLRFSRFNASFRHLVWGFGGFAQRFRGLAPRCSGAVRRFASVRCGAVEKARRFSTYPQFVFHSLFHGVEKMSTFPCVSPRLSVFPPQGAPIPSRRGEERSPSRARIYNIGAEKGEKGSAPFAAFRCGRGLLGARDAERWFRPVVKGLTDGRGSQKGVGECVGGGAAGGARRGGVSESGRAGALRLHPSRNGRRGTGAPRSMRLHNSRSISSIVSERCVQIMINVGRSNKFLHNFSTVLYISPVKTSSAHRFFVRCAENLCFTLFFCPAVVKKHPETPQG